MEKLLAVYVDHIDVWLPEMLFFSITTLEIAIVSFVLAVAIGLVLVMLRVSKISPLVTLAILIIEVARGLPIVVLLYIVYFVPPQLVSGWNWSWYNAFVGAVLGLGIHGGAILAEVFRAGIEALHKGQREAALSLGMTPAKSMRYILVPQAARIVLPPVANYGIGLLKETSLCSLIGVNELMNDAKSIAFADYEPMAVFLLAAAIYFAMSYPLALILRHVEKRLNFSR
ncbi:MAG: amino acid ABC transporter permease [Mesorhizobium sp.]|uniref:amino acid ABC transporter permease n=1 Tax=Mesorhizobium sp. TaxID=1871066 RepID=UPI000FE7075E|nr:amino acid ABC transporter permease [Mesorhizobium sp.]RWB75884.1 MAG: amino acid ABC transporter permease [Mesorhizobium sp.]